MCGFSRVWRLPRAALHGCAVSLCPGLWLSLPLRGGDSRLRKRHLTWRRHLLYDRLPVRRRSSRTTDFQSVAEAGSAWRAAMSTPATSASCFALSGRGFYMCGFSRVWRLPRAALHGCAVSLCPGLWLSLSLRGERTVVPAAAQQFDVVEQPAYTCVDRVAASPLMVSRGGATRLRRVALPWAMAVAAPSGRRRRDSRTPFKFGES